MKHVFIAFFYAAALFQALPFRAPEPKVCHMGEACHGGGRECCCVPHRASKPEFNPCKAAETAKASPGLPSHILPPSGAALEIVVIHRPLEPQPFPSQNSPEPPSKVPLIFS